MPSEPRSPGTRTSRRHGTRRADDAWVPGTRAEPSTDGPGAAALERLEELRQADEPEAPLPPERQTDQGDDLESAIDDLAEQNDDQGREE